MSYIYINNKLWEPYNIAPTGKCFSGYTLASRFLVGFQSVYFEEGSKREGDNQ